jgi:quercetin dioxygenase-like cupin family protein
MLILRWQAPTPPNAEQVRSILESEGLEPNEERVLKEQKHVEKKHPFGEVRVVVSGELFLTVAGTQLLLRAGDRIEIPANTRHSYSTHGQEALTYYSHRPF